ncbi:hypothetical protein D3C72_1665550 [compost metagenome]
MFRHQYLGLHARYTGAQDVAIHQAGKNIFCAVPGEDFFQLFSGELLPAQQRIDFLRTDRYPPDRRTAARQCQQQHRVNVRHLGQAVAQLLQDVALWQVHLEDRVQFPVAVFVQAHRH